VTETESHVKVTESQECKFRCLILYSDLERLHGAIPRDIGDMTELRSITIDKCTINGGLPDSLAKLTKLNSLEIWDSIDDGSSFPKVLREMKSIRHLELWANEMTGGIPEWICDLTWLKKLWYHSLSPNPGI
jgi:hypothetical protein